MGFQQMCDVVGGISIVFSIVYFFACSGWEGFKSSFNRRENRGARGDNNNANKVLSDIMF